MEPISNVDRLVVLLRRRLLERSKAAGSARKDKAGGSGERAGEVSQLRALAAIEGVDDRQLKRALIQNILADQFGNEMLNEAKFQQMVDRVTEGLEGEPGSATLLTRVVGELRASARA
jgi:hypothetical protein